ncbi:Crp/Fnr family transcriptional regulator [Marinobacter sp. F4216]|uniref:Crp/Fnr family transcriptional regulator n=1 Tax=Marinobacter sp. F4216 TaxID=2874281 RepID=UPI001CBEDD7F|nr:Crp/Fnr family transcriptional regulator [Marinobacter sp. F4216]MBZ2168628.1 Crp/Fnr family transcriptional regulator [Marinobacter sp. F4216]
MAASVRHTYGKNSIIVTEGELSHSLYVILQGEVIAYVSDEDGNINIVNRLNEGDYFGELSLIDGGPRSASVEAVTQCQMLILSRTDFLTYLEANPKVAIRLLEGMGQRMRNTTLHAKELALMDVFGRIASVLRKSATEEDGVLITPPLTQQAIADEVGASREMVSRILKDLRIGGYIDTIEKRIVIKKRIPDRW